MTIGALKKRVRNIVGIALATTLDRIHAFKLPPEAPVNPWARVMFVCLGNICRSPLAEAIFRRLLQENGMASEVAVYSAGVSAANQGSGAFWRARLCARRHGLNISSHRARQVTLRDLQQCDYVMAMDKSDLKHLTAMAPSAIDAQRIGLLLACSEVPDPIAGDHRMFDRVFAQLEKGCRALLAEVEQKFNRELSCGHHTQ
jgi:low molecular weight protein-tyrosine phosphatase